MCTLVLFYDSEVRIFLYYGLEFVTQYTYSIYYHSKWFLIYLQSRSMILSVYYHSRSLLLVIKLRCHRNAVAHWFDTKSPSFLLLTLLPLLHPFFLI